MCEWVCLSCSLLYRDSNPRCLHLFLPLLTMREWPASISAQHETLLSRLTAHGRFVAVFARGNCRESSHFHVGWVSHGRPPRRRPSLTMPSRTSRRFSRRASPGAVKATPASPRSRPSLVPRRAQNQLVDKQLYLAPVMRCLAPRWASSVGLIELEHEARLRPRLVRAELSSPARLRLWTLNNADPTPPPLAWSGATTGTAPGA